MELREIQDMLERYIKGEASGKERELLETWFLEAEHESEDMPDIGLHDFRRVQVLNQLRKKFGRPARVIPFRRLVAAACVLALISLSYLNRYRLLDIVNPIAIERVKALPYEVKRLELPDRSIVYLNAGSEITYPKRFRGAARQVEVSGEAFFTVASRSEQPFTVDASGLEIKVLGTSFLVANSGASAQATVFVQSGKVQVSPGGSRSGRSLLGAHQELIFDKAGNKAIVDSNTTVDINWIKHKLIFKNATLGQVFNQIGNTYGIKIQAADSAVKSILFTGAFDATDSSQSVLTILSLSYDLDIHQNENGIVLIRKKN